MTLSPVYRTVHINIGLYHPDADIEAFCNSVNEMADAFEIHGADYEMSYDESDELYFMKISLFISMNSDVAEIVRKIRVYALDHLRAKDVDYQLTISFSDTTIEADNILVEVIDV